MPSFGLTTALPMNLSGRETISAVLSLLSTDRPQQMPAPASSDEIRQRVASPPPVWRTLSTLGRRLFDIFVASSAWAQRGAIPAKMFR
jgi:hypothetical protein